MKIILFLSSELLNLHSWELFSPSLPETGHTLRGTLLPICTLRYFFPPLGYWYQFPAVPWAPVPRAFWFLLVKKPMRPKHQHCWSPPAHQSGLVPTVPPQHMRGLPSIKGQLHFLQSKYSIFESSVCTLLFSASTAQFYSSCFKAFDSRLQFAAPVQLCRVS